jgi:hypothetical protein
MSRPRGRQKDWDLFYLDHQGNIIRADKGWLDNPPPPGATEGTASLESDLPLPGFPAW